jgi:hypothetical protein
MQNKTTATAAQPRITTTTTLITVLSSIVTILSLTACENPFSPKRGGAQNNPSNYDWPAGNHWAAAKAPPTGHTTTTWTDVVWGATEYVAVGSGGAIALSTDGDTWEPVASGTTHTLRAVAWRATEYHLDSLFRASYTGEYAAVGDSGTLLTSQDGRTWTPINWGGTTAQLTAVQVRQPSHPIPSVDRPWLVVGNSHSSRDVVAAKAGVYVPAKVAAVESSTVIALQSNDGIVWTVDTLYADTGMRHVSKLGSIRIGYSQNSPVRTIAFGLGLPFMTEDGTMWTNGSRDVINTSAVHCSFVWCHTVTNDTGSAGVSRMRHSENGINWDATGTHSKPIYAVQISHNRLVTVGALGEIRTIDANAIWKLRPSGTLSNLYGLASRQFVQPLVPGDPPMRLVAVGANGTIVVSR